jgi:hypothetical protein
LDNGSAGTTFGEDDLGVLTAFGHHLGSCWSVVIKKVKASALPHLFNASG